MRLSMLNKAPGVCVVCGETVAAGEGHFVKIKGNGWKVQHGQCPAVTRAHASLNAMALTMLEAARASLKFDEPPANPTSTEGA